MSQQHLYSKTVTIAASGTTSTSLELDGAFALVGIIMSAGWDAANITVQQSMDERDIDDGSWTPTNWKNGYDDAGNAVTFTVAADRFINLSQNVLLASRHIRLISSATQTAQRILTCVYRAVG